MSCRLAILLQPRISLGFLQSIYFFLEMVEHRLFSNFQLRSRFRYCLCYHISSLRGLSQDQLHCCQKNQRSDVNSTSEFVATTTTNEFGEHGLQRCFNIPELSYFFFHLTSELSLEELLLQLLTNSKGVNLSRFRFRLTY